LNFKNGLPYLRCWKPTETEISSLLDVDWDPKQYDITVDDIEQFHNTSQVELEHEHFDQYGDYQHWTVATHSLVSEEEFFDALEYFKVADIVDDIIDTLHPDNVWITYVAHLSNITPASPNFELLCPLFAWTPADTIKCTFEVTNQYARSRVSDTIKQHWRSMFPVCNVKRRNEPVDTNTVFSDTLAVDSSVTLVADVYGLKTYKGFVNTLEDNIRERGAMDNVISDCAKAEMIDHFKHILCALCISAWHSEPYHERQNFAENQYATINATTNRVLNTSGASADTWLLALMYVRLLLNHLESSTLGWKTPMKAVTGQTTDISKFLLFSFYELVYYHSYSDTYPSASNEEHVWWLGVATHVSDKLTYKILTQKKWLIYRSANQSAMDPAK
jgi:hypothetical protein